MVEKKFKLLHLYSVRTQGLEISKLLNKNYYLGLKQDKITTFLIIYLWFMNSNSEYHRGVSQCQ